MFLVYQLWELNLAHTWLGFLSENEALKTLDIAVKTDDENDCGDLFK